MCASDGFYERFSEDQHSFEFREEDWFSSIYDRVIITPWRPGQYFRGLEQWKRRNSSADGRDGKLLSDARAAYWKIHRVWGNDKQCGEMVTRLRRTAMDVAHELRRLILESEGRWVGIRELKAALRSVIAEERKSGLCHWRAATSVLVMDDKEWRARAVEALERWTEDRVGEDDEELIF